MAKSLKDNMRLIQFIKWWWNDNDYFNRTIASFIVFCIIPCLFGIIWFGAKSVIAIFIGVGLTLAGWGLYGIFYWLRSLWQKFDREHPPEDVEIINRLKGVSATMHRDDYYD